MALNINGTTGISGVDGSVSAPALTGTDSNTGITFPSADTIKFSTGGVERMSITNSGVTGAGGKFASYAVICDQKAQGTGGGTFTAGAWRTRDLNTEIADADGIVSISNNQFTLQAGTYLVKASAPGRKITTNQTALYNVTDSSYTQYGTLEIAHVSYIGGSRSFISARFTISSAKAFEIRHFSSHTAATTGFGTAFGSSDATTAGGVAIFTIVEIFKES